jgi:hypothetical protein
MTPRGRRQVAMRLRGKSGIRVAREEHLHQLIFVRFEVFTAVTMKNAVLLVTANVFPSSPILVTLMMKTLRSSETSVLTRPTWRTIPEDGILQISF